MGRQYHGLIIDDDECMELLVSAHLKLDSALGMLNEIRSARDVSTVSPSRPGRGVPRTIDVAQELVDEAAMQLDAAARTLTPSG